MTICQKLHRVDTISIKISITFFRELEKNPSYPSEMRTHTHTHQSDPKQKGQRCRFTLPHLKLYFRIVVMKPRWCQRSTDAIFTIALVIVLSAHQCFGYTVDIYYLITRFSLGFYSVFLLAISIFCLSVLSFYIFILIQMLYDRAKGNILPSMSCLNCQ